MSSIEEQLRLEEQMVAYGIDRFEGKTRLAEEQGVGSTCTYATILIKSFILPIAESIDEYKKLNLGKNGKYRKLIKEVDSEKIAFFTLKAMFNHFIKTETVQSLAISIGRHIEDELKFTKFQEEEPDYYNSIIADFRKRGTNNYRYMHRVLTFKANQREVSWNDWTNEERVRVGTAMLNILMDVTNLVTRKTVTLSRYKRKVLLVPTQEALEWVDRHKRDAGVLHPDRAPCVIPPDDWVSYNQGGYYSPRLRLRSPLIKTRSKEHRVMIEKADLSRVMKAVNTVQAVPWSINKDVLDVVLRVWDSGLGVGLPSSSPISIPPSPVERSIKKKAMNEEQFEAFNVWKKEAALLHCMEKERVSKCFQVGRVLRMANEYKEYDKFWFVYQCDFRGRMYTSTSGFSPQGPDFSKAVLKFHEGKPLGKNGMYWLKVHGANTYGKDKGTYDDRVNWVESCAVDIQRAAEDPIRNREFWSNADKPWQFLAFCFEYKEALVLGDAFVSHLPIALDGSCNGLQNFSAMLRDKVGAKATNVAKTEIPSDIYATVSTVLTDKVLNSTEPVAKGWCNFIRDYGDEGVFSRNLSKRPVMTLPYGSTKQSCTDYVFRYYMDTAPEYFGSGDRFTRCAWLTKLLWESIGEVVIAARSGMDWLQAASSYLSKKNLPIIWCTSVGFPVYQATKKFETKKIDTQLAGRLQFKLGTESNVLDIRKQKQGISPNFVHSMDACHLMTTLIKAQEEGLRSFACIHDDFGVHAVDTDKFHRIIRESFVSIYSTDVLKEFKDNHERLYDTTMPELPAYGEFDIQEVLQSKYFFG